MIQSMTPLRLNLTNIQRSFDYHTLWRQCLVASDFLHKRHTHALLRALENDLASVYNKITTYRSMLAINRSKSSGMTPPFI
jgi:hypothetical protein